MVLLLAYSRKYDGPLHQDGELVSQNVHLSWTFQVFLGVSPGMQLEPGPSSINIGLEFYLFIYLYLLLADLAVVACPESCERAALFAQPETGRP